MYAPKPGTKQDPVRRWNLPDRAFFGHGACHMLAYVFLERFPSAGFYALWIKPGLGYHGNHVFVTDGIIAFDYHGYCGLDRLVSHHIGKYSRQYPGWNAEICRVDGDLSKPQEMAEVGMHVRGASDYHHDALPRARDFLNKYDDQHQEHVPSVEDHLSDRSSKDR